MTERSAEAGSAGFVGFLKKKAPVFGSVALVWIALALGAYGLALKDYAKQCDELLATASAGPQGLTLPEAELETRQGRVVATTVGRSSSQEPELTLEGSDDALRIAPEAIGGEQERKALENFVRAGTRLHARIAKKSKLVLELQANWGMVDQRDLLTVPKTLQRLSHGADGARARAKIYFGLALVTLGLIPLLFAIQRAWAPSMKTVRNASTTGSV